jgi:hypothetical protein
MQPTLRAALILGSAVLLGAAQSGGGQGGAPPAEGSVEKPQVRLPTSTGTLLSGTPRPEGDAVLEAPRPVGAPVIAESQPLAADAVIASETMRFLPLHFLLAGPIALGPPFNAHHPAGTDVRRLTRDGTIRNCIGFRGAYRPAVDEHGEIYPGLCLEDRDQDGHYETAILEPYNPERAPVRIVAIAPVGLDPNPSAAEDDPRAIRVKRRIRVTHVGPEGARIAAEQGSATAREAEVTSYYGRPEDSVILPLRDGAIGSLGGIEFRLRRDGAGWRIAATGRFTPWLELRENSTLIVAGGMEFRRRHEL